MITRVLAGIAAAAALLWAVWLVAVPADTILEAALSRLEGGPLEVRFIEFDKGLFYNFSAQAIELYYQKRKVLQVDDFKGHISLPSLLMLKLSVPFEARAGGGRISGLAEIGRGGHSLNVALSGARLENFPDALALAQAQGSKGALAIEAHMANSGGEIKLTLEEAALVPLMQDEGYVPLNMFSTVRGMFELRGRDVIVKSLALEGKGIYARASGTLKGPVADMSLELMPEDEGAFKMLLAKYRKDKGYYVVPIKRHITGA